ncbi:RAVE protein 1 C terminal-domain-containing protein [Pisolithus croceorrhizus]|nr:RAVE protein 1 C terminal-domain-containing protein [Pisolithus croceorrhizus]
MLELTRTFTGCPAGPLKYLVLPHANLIVYPSADAVVILNASSLSLVRVLALREVFPGTQQTVSCLAVDPALKVIVVSTGTRIAAWSLSGVQSNIFRVHSSLILPDGDPVTALDCRAGLLAIGSQKGLSVFTLILENDLLTWTKKCAVTPRSVAFSPTLAYIATTTTPDATQVRVYSTASGIENQVITHPRPVSDVLWRYSSTSRGDDPVLFTVTSDSVLRIFLPVVDSPHRLQLHLAIDSFTSLTPSNNLGISSYSTSKIIWLDKEIIGPVVKTLLEGSSVDSRDVETEKLREIDEEKLDLFIRVFGDGSLVFSAVANIDRKPPTLLRHFIISRSPPGAIYPPPLNIYILPRAELTGLTLVTSPPLRTFEVSALSLLSGQADSFLLCAAGLDKLPLQDSKVSHFVRTPAGRGVAVVRESGGETWMVTDSGANLFQVKSWPSADHVVVLDGGKLIATYSADHSELLLHSNPPSVLTLPRISALFSAPSQSEHESIVGVTDEMSILHIHISTTPCPTLVLHSCDALPLPKRPKLILPVDPMAWSGTTMSDYDHLLSISDEGELRFWILEHGKSSGWRCTGKVRTGRTKFTNARCSSAKKSVLVTRDADGQELTIWDSNESEFASGLEHRRIFSAAEPIHDLDWASTPDNQSILAVGFTHHVELLCQQRKTYFDDDPGWVIYCKVEIGSFVPYPISDSIWLANGSFLVGAGHQMFLFSQTSSFARDTSCSLFESVARSNGPLDDYHPQMLLQCLLWGKLSLVKRIIVKMAQSSQTSNEFHWQPLPIEEYYGKEWTTRRAKPYDFLVGSTNQGELSEDQGFSRALVESLIEQLETHPLSHLTPNEHAHLIVLIQTTLEIDEQRRALDANGFRYVLSMRSFYILNRRIASDPNSPQSGGDIARKTGWRDRLRYRDMIWAFHSESQDILLNTSVAACNGKMLWSDARALGVFIWLNSVDVMRSHMETIARNQYMSGDLRDPTACSLFYFALGKFKLVHGLWRQAVWHKEQAIMLKFLSNDFTKPRWKTAALKNAYVLLSKQRFEYAAAFFLLGGSLKDAVSVCIKQLSDFQLAIALARVVEQGNDGPVFQGILRNTVLPMAVEGGNKWLCSWAFWMLRRRDLSVRVLLTPLQDIVDAFGISVKDVGEPYFDDPSLALLFSQLRSKTLQTATGTSEISGKSEFNFVLQVARVFCRMGCHALALDLVRSWSFERPTAVPAVDFKSPPSPETSHGSLTRDPFLLRRRSSIVIDMDIESRTPSGQSTPKARATVREEEPDRLARKAGLGSLIKSAKHDIQVPEFDLNAFF